MTLIDESATSSICQIRRSPACLCPPERPPAFCPRFQLSIRFSLGTFSGGVRKKAFLSSAVDLARLMIVFVWEILPITNPASFMFPPVFLEGERLIAVPPRRFPHFSTGWRSSPLQLVPSMLLHVVSHKCKELRFLMIFPGHALTPGRPSTIFRTPAGIILDLSMMSIFAAIMVPMIVTVFNIRFVFGVELQ